jgi:hypothetical protein
MPVPPQESAPSLSPRQSFGCQSPLPWVTGTDRTGILWALRQLQGFLPGVLFFPCALPHLEGSLTGQQASRSPVLRNHNISTENTGKAFKRFNWHRIISRDDFRSRLHAQASSIFPTPPGILPLEFNTGNSVQEMRTRNFSGTDIISTLLDQGIHAFLSTTQANGFRDNPDIRQGSYRFHAQGGGVRFRMEAREHSRLSSAFLFACTRVDTCHPGNCMHPIRTPSSHHLETHGSFQRT